MVHVQHLLRMYRTHDVTSTGRTRIISLFAGLVLAIILAPNILLWPIPYLGFEVHPQTHVVTHIEPGSSSDHAGMHVGDRVVRLYNRPITEVFQTITYIGWIAPRDQSIPIIIERDGHELALQLTQDPPSIASQVSILAIAGLALLCWLTGYVLGIGRYQTVLESHVVAYFWIGIGGVIGCLPFASSMSIPLLVVLAWLVIGVLVPLAVYMHLFFPPRRPLLTSPSRAKSYLVAAVVLLNGSLIAAVSIIRPHITELLQVLLSVLPVALVVGLGGSAVILQQSYQRTPVAHTRRQIRLIATACGIVACCWIVLQIVPMLTLGYRLVPRDVLFVMCGLVPLAYLVSTVTPDLYRLDRGAVRCLVHLATITLLGALLFLLDAHLHLDSTAASVLLALCFVVLYRPVQHAISGLLPSNNASVQQIALDRAITGLAQTLDPERLVAALVEGVRSSFGQPALAVFVGDIYGSDELTLGVHERLLGLPSTLPAGTLTDVLRHVDTPIDSWSLYQRVQMVSLTPEEQQILAHPNISLWGPIRHSQGHLLGLLLLGMRGDFDPYRPEDQAAVQRLLNAAALAFANSAAHVQQQKSEATIRDLYRRLQTMQDTTARELAQELHDEIINVHVRLNIKSLNEIADHTSDPHLQKEIAVVLESLRTMGDDLRRICEDLYPTGLNDIFGLGAVLRDQLRKEQARWEGQCQFQETGHPLPIAARVQREALRIMKEALTNAIKHAAANAITVHLQYPSMPHEPVQLTISDDGQASSAVVERAGHLGIRYMYESASAAGGMLRIERQVGKGTTIVFTFWAIVDNANDEHNQPEGTSDAAA